MEGELGVAAERWEYWETVGLPNVFEMDKLGLVGWELVTIVSPQFGTYFRPERDVRDERVIWKRLLIEQPEEEPAPPEHVTRLCPACNGGGDRGYMPQPGDLIVEVPSLRACRMCAGLGHVPSAGDDEVLTVLYAALDGVKSLPRDSLGTVYSEHSSPQGGFVNWPWRDDLADKIATVIRNYMLRVGRWPL